MNAISGTRRAMRERFLEKISEDENGCWLWQACRFPNGYGALQVDRKKVGAHRISHEIFIGPIPAGRMVLHRCDVPACVNPEHLFLGTAKVNAQDRDAKGRHPPCRGDRNGASKLVGPEREAAITEFLASPGRGAAVAAKYGLTYFGLRKAAGAGCGRAAGDANKKAKLNDAKVLAIRAELLDGKSIAEIARQYGVAWPQIKRIKTGKGWKHV